MKGYKHHVAVIATSLLAMACGTKSKMSEAELTTPLDDNAWSMSQWISAADAQVVTGKIDENTNNRVEGIWKWLFHGKEIAIFGAMK